LLTKGNSLLLLHFIEILVYNIFPRHKRQN